MRLDELHSAVLFTIMRNRCMRNADISALYYLYRVLQKGPSELNLKKQLKKEYGKPFEKLMKDLDANMPPPAPEVSSKDIEEALEFLRQSGRFKEELEDYTPGDIETKKTANMGIQVGPEEYIA